MIRLFVALESDEVRYVPVPCKGNVAAAHAVWQTSTVEPNDTIILSRAATAVNTITAVNTAGLATETGVPNATIAERDLIFDPASSTATETVIRVTPNGAAGDALVVIDYDDSCYVQQEATESA